MALKLLNLQTAFKHFQTIGYFYKQLLLQCIQLNSMKHYQLYMMLGVHSSRLWTLDNATDAVMIHVPHFNTKI